MKYRVFLNKGAKKSLARLEEGHRALMLERLRGWKISPTPGSTW